MPTPKDMFIFKRLNKIATDTSVPIMIVHDVVSAWTSDHFVLLSILSEAIEDDAVPRVITQWETLCDCKKVIVPPRERKPDESKEKKNEGVAVCPPWRPFPTL